jgi:hypothetical protein
MVHPLRTLPAVLLGMFLAVPATPVARAEQPPACEPQEPRVPRGFSVRTALGPAFWTGDVGGDSHPGMMFVFGAGYELFSWLAVEATWASGFHETDQPRPPAPGSFATHVLNGGLRLALPLEPFDLFLRGGAGIMWSRPDILVRIPRFDGKTRVGWLGGAGFNWHTPRRHVWIGLEVDALGAVDFPGILVLASAVIGVTL